MATTLMCVGARKRVRSCRIRFDESKFIDRLMSDYLCKLSEIVCNRQPQSMHSTECDTNFTQMNRLNRNRAREENRDRRVNEKHHMVALVCLRLIVLRQFDAHDVSVKPTARARENEKTQQKEEATVKTKRRKLVAID